MIRVAIIDDHAMVRGLLRDVMAHSTDVEIVDDFDHARGFLEVVHKHDYDVIIFDVSMPDVDGIEAIAELRKRGERTPILCLTMHLNATIMRRAFHAGANGYAVKHDPFDVLVTAIHQVAKGKRFISPSMQDLEPQDQSVEEVLAMLSAREREIFDLVANGLTALAIADTLSISERTVDFHRRKIGQKTGLKRIPDIVKFATEAGLTKR